MQNLCSRLSALFRGTNVVKHLSQKNVVKHPFYSIGPKMVFGSVSKHFANLRHAKRCKTFIRALVHYFGVTKLLNMHSTPLDEK
jgi:hypothetical protein